MSLREKISTMFVRHYCLIFLNFLASYALSQNSLTVQDSVCIGDTVFLDGKYTFSVDLCPTSISNNNFLPSSLGSSQIDQPYDLASFQKEDTTYLIVFGFNQTSIEVFKFDEEFNILDNYQLNSNVPTGGGDIITYGSIHYLITSSRNDGSLTLYRLYLESRELEEITTINNILTDARNMGAVAIKDTIFTFTAYGGNQVYKQKIYGDLRDNPQIESTTVAIPNASTLTGSKPKNINGNWVLFSQGFTSGIHLINFGSNLNSSSPSFTQISQNPCNAIFPITEGDTSYIFNVYGSIGNLRKITLNNDLNGITNSIDLGNFGGTTNGGFNDFTFASSTITTKSGISLLSANFNSGSISRLFLEPECSPKYLQNTNSFTLTSTGLNRFVFEKTDSLNHVFYQKDSLFLRNATSPIVNIDVIEEWCNKDSLRIGIDFSNYSRLIWNINGLDTISSQSPDSSILFLTEQRGSFQIDVTGVSEDNCDFSSVAYFDLFNPILPIFNLPPTVCSGNNILLENQSDSNEVVKWRWIINDQFIDSSYAPNFSFSAGDAEVSLIADVAQCSDTVTQNIQILEGTTLSISGSDFCQGETATFTNTSDLGSLSSSLWFIDTLLVSSGFTFDSLFTIADSFELTLLALDTNGCENGITEQYTIQPIPNIEISLNQSCSNETIQFSDSSSIVFGEIDSVIYKINNIFYSANELPVLTEGTYSYSSIAVSGFGCSDTTDEMLFETYSPPTASISILESTCFGRNVRLSSSLVGTAIKNEWVINSDTSINDTIEINNESNPSEVFLSITDSNNCNSSIDTIIGNISLFEELEVIDTLCLNETFLFYLEQDSISSSFFSACSLIDTTSLSFHGQVEINSRINVPYQMSALEKDENSLVLLSDFNNGIFFFLKDQNNNYTQTFLDDDDLSASKILGGELYSLRDTVYATLSTEDGFVHTYKIDSLDSGVQFTRMDTYESGIISPRYVQHLIRNDSLYLFIIGGGIRETFLHVSVSPTNELSNKEIKNTRVNANSFSSGLSIVNQTFEAVQFVSTSPTENEITLFNYYYKKDSVSILMSQTYEGAWGVSSVYAGSNAHIFISSASNKEVNYTTLQRILLDKPLINLGEFESQVGPNILADVAGNEIVLNIVGADSLFQSILSNNCGSLFHFGESLRADLSYGDPGIKEIDITLIDTSGCPISYSTTLVVNNNNAPDPFIMYGDMFCLGDTLTLTQNDNSNESISRISWVIDSDSLSNDSLLNFASNVAGVYEVELLAVTDKRCSGSVKDTIQIYEPTRPDFLGPDEICTSTSVRLINTSIGEIGDSVQWSWTINDTLFTSESININYIFDTVGLYLIQLKSTLPGCSDSISQTITVNQTPEFSFSADEVCLGENTEFELSVIEGNLDNYTWNFGDGDTVSNSNNPIHLFDSASTFFVSIEGISAEGCADTFGQNYFVRSNPVADFDFGLSCDGETTALFDRSSSDNDPIVNWTWNTPFDTVQERNPNILFPLSGEHIIELISQSDFGCTDTVVDTIITIASPLNDFEIDLQCIGQASELTNLSIDPIGTIIDYEWTIQNESETITYSSENPSHIFAISDTFLISLQTTSSSGCRKVLVDTLLVPSQPSLNFDYSLPCQNGVVTFNSNNTLDSRDSIVDIYWLFESIGIVQGDTVAINFENQTEEIVRLNIETEKGCIESYAERVTLLQRPNADFNLNATAGLTPFVINASNSSTSSSNYEWLLDTTLLSINTNLVDTISENGTFALTLVATNGNGCSDSITQQLFVGDLSVDIELTEILPEETNDEIQLNIVLTNNGSVPLEDLEIDFDFGGLLEVSTLIDTIVEPSQTLSWVYSSSITADQFDLLSYICAQIHINENLAALETDTTNNNTCFIQANTATFSSPYPNPATEFIQMQHLSIDNTIVQLKLFDLTGKVLGDYRITPDTGPNTYTLRIETLNPSIYLLYLKQGDIEKTFRFVVE